MGPSEILQLLQTASVLLAIFVAIGTLKGRNSDKTAEFTEMRVDIKYIKERIGDMENQRDDIVELRASAKSAHRRIDDHLKYDHQKSVEERGV